MKIEEINKLNADEAQDALQKEVDSFKENLETKRKNFDNEIRKLTNESVSNPTSIDEAMKKKDEMTESFINELKQIDLDIDKEQADFDEYLKKQEYELPTEDVEFEGRKWKVQQIMQKIIYHLNRNEQSFVYVAGLHALVTIWKRAELSKIPYGVYDSTLRILGQLKYKGDAEWVEIMVINTYLQRAHEAYTRDIAMMHTLADMRSHVDSMIQLYMKGVGDDGIPVEQG